MDENMKRWMKNGKRWIKKEMEEEKDKKGLVWSEQKNNRMRRENGEEKQENEASGCKNKE